MGPWSAIDASTPANDLGSEEMFRSKRPAEMRAMPEGKPPTPFEDDAEECLHCAIVEMVEERIAAGGADAANLAALIAESLVDVILRVPEEEQAKLMAHTLAALGDFFSSEERRRRRQLRIDALTGETPTDNYRPHV